MQALAQVNAQYQDLQAKTGGFAAGATAAFANFAKEVQSTGQVMQNVITTGLNGITNAFAQMVTTGKANWQSLIDSMEQMLVKSALTSLLNSLFKSLGSALGGSGGFLGALGSAFGGGHASGGDVTPGKSYLVGEQGPELLQVGAAGSSIVPNGQMGGSGGSGSTIIVNQNIQTPDVNSFKMSAGQLHSQAYQQAASKAARFNS